MVERSSWDGGEYGFDADAAEEERARRERTARFYEARAPRGGRGRGRGGFRDGPHDAGRGGRGRGGVDDRREPRRDARRGGEEERRPVRPSSRGDREARTAGRSAAPGARDGPDEEDDFFASLMSELSDDLADEGRDGARTSGTRHHDDAGRNANRGTPARDAGGAEDSFFENLMAELSEGLDDDSSSASSAPGRGNAEELDDDEFFRSLEEELSQSLGGEDKVTKGSSGTGASNDDDDFFANLQREMDKALDDEPPSASEAIGEKEPLEIESSNDEDDFFASLQRELGDNLDEEPASREMGDTAAEEEVEDSFRGGRKESSGIESFGDDDDFFASLEREMGNELSDEPSSQETTDDISEDDFFSLLMDESGNDLPTDANANAEATQADDFFSDLADDATPEETTTSPQPSSEHKSDLTSLTVPLLKDLLRSKGLKVGGKKAELIERLQNQP